MPGVATAARLTQATTLAALLLTCASAAYAQTTTQLWGNLTLDWVKNERLATAAASTGATSCSTSGPGPVTPSMKGSRPPRTSSIFG